MAPRHGFFIERRRFPLDEAQRPGGTIPDTGAQAVAVALGHDPRLAGDDFQRPLRASGDAVSAAIAEFFIDFDYLAQYLHDISFPENSPAILTGEAE